MKNEVWAVRNPESGVLEISFHDLRQPQESPSLEQQTWTYITPNAPEPVGQHGGPWLWGGGDSGAGWDMGQCAFESGCE